MAQIKNRSLTTATAETATMSLALESHLVSTGERLALFFHASSDMCSDVRFGYERSANAGNHSSGVLSNSIADITTHLKYVFIFAAKSTNAYLITRNRPRNLLLCGITPGRRSSQATNISK